MNAAVRTVARILPALAVAVLSTGGVTVSATDQSSAGAAERIFELRIENGKLAGGTRVIRVTQGDAVRLRWTADAPVVLHLHGYDIERKVEPGTVAEMAFTARATGRFSISIHGEAGASKSAHHHHSLAHLEVHPR